MIILLDLFCGAGGAAMGYHRAFEAAGIEHRIVGVDNKRQPRYPFEFVQADAMTFPLEGFDAVHASPPCQAYSQAALGTGKTYPDLVPGTRERLLTSGAAWVIENVPGAPLRADFKLCGCMFDLKLRRVRWFETSWHHFALRQPCLHAGPVVSVVGRGTPTWVRKVLGFNPTIHDHREAMGIDWMNFDELSQAVPPAYTEYIGRALIQEVMGRC